MDCLELNRHRLMVIIILVSASTMKWLSDLGIALGVACALPAELCGMYYLSKATEMNLRYLTGRLAKLCLSAVI